MKFLRKRTSHLSVSDFLPTLLFTVHHLFSLGLDHLVAWHVVQTLCIWLILLSKRSKPADRGYSDDPRNTNDAWIETSAWHVHCPAELADELEAGLNSEHSWTGQVRRMCDPFFLARAADIDVE